MGASSKPAKSLAFIFVFAFFCSARPSARVRTRPGPNATTAAHGATNPNGPKFKPNAEPSAESSTSSSSSAADNMTMVDSSSTLDPSTTIPPGTNLSSPAAQAEPPAGKIQTVFTPSADKQEDDEEQTVSTPKHMDFTPRAVPAVPHASIAANTTTTAEQGTAANQTVSTDVTTAANETVGAVSNNETAAAVNASEPVGVGRKDIWPGIPDLPRLFRRHRHQQPAKQPDTLPPPQYPGATPPTTTITHTVSGYWTYHDSMTAPSASTPASVAHQTINPPVTAANHTSNATGNAPSNTTVLKDTRPASSPSGNGSNVVVVRTPGGNESAAAVTVTVNQTTVSGDNGNGSSYSTVIVGPVGAPVGARPPIPGTARGPPNPNDLKATPTKLRPHLNSGRNLKRRYSTQHDAGCKEVSGNATATPTASKQGAQNTTTAGNVTSTAPGGASNDSAAAATVTGAGLLLLP